MPCRKRTGGTISRSASIHSFASSRWEFELVAKTVQPWINKTADRNFIETLGFREHFFADGREESARNAAAGARLPTVDVPTRNELVSLCYRAAQRYAKDDAATSAAPYVLAQRVEMPTGVASK